MKYLLDSFVSFYSDTLLSTISCRLKYGPTNGLSGLLSRDDDRFLQHPIRHLLLINFLGQTVRQLILEFSGYEPFGSGPWPCKNKAADHFGKLLIKDCKVLDSQHRKGAPFGILSCECGYAYTLYGVGPANDYQHGAVLSYGPIWEESLRKLWKGHKHKSKGGGS